MQCKVDRRVREGGKKKEKTDRNKRIKIECSGPRDWGSLPALCMQPLNRHLSESGQENRAGQLVIGVGVAVGSDI
jgi:hypothetical protein